jgi:hypothetical protein
MMMLLSPMVRFYLGWTQQTTPFDLSECINRGYPT